MNKPFRACILLLCLPALAFAQQNAGPAASPAQPEHVPPDPVLIHRPPPRPASPASMVAPEGRIKLDVLVTDAEGKPVSGLEPLDFKLLDDGQPRKILSFRFFDRIVSKPDPPVEVILLIDTANLPFDQVAFTRQEIARFLRRNGGHLAQPVSIILLSEAGLRVQPQPSTDGNALLTVLDGIKGTIRTINAAQGAGGDLERFQLSVRHLATIAENEARKPGRKLLIWVGPGWPMLDSANLVYQERDRRRYFDSIVELSTRLREARIVLYSVSPLESTTGSGTRTFVYRDFLKGVKSARQAATGDLALKVLAIQSGGRILGPDNDLAGQIDNCIQDANVFYRLSFDPPLAELADEYHDLKVEIGKPGLAARTNTGYYNQP